MTRVYSYRRGDGNEGNFARAIVELSEGDSPFAALRALVINDFISGHSRRRWIARALELDGESDHPLAVIYEGPRGESAFGAAWLTAELKPIPESELTPCEGDDAPYFWVRGGCYVKPAPIRDHLDKGARAILAKGDSL